MHEFVNIDFTTPVISNNNNNAIIAKRQTQRNYKRLMTFMHVWRLTWILTNLLANFCHVYWKMLQNILGWNRRHSCVIHTMTVWPSVAWLVIRRFTNRFRVISAKMGHQVNWDIKLTSREQQQSFVVYACVQQYRYVMLLSALSVRYITYSLQCCDCVGEYQRFR